MRLRHELDWHIRLCKNRGLRRQSELLNHRLVRERLSHLWVSVNLFLDDASFIVRFGSCCDRVAPLGPFQLDLARRSTRCVCLDGTGRVCFEAEALAPVIVIFRLHLYEIHL